MFYSAMKLSTILILILLLTNTTYSKIASKDSNTISRESSALLENNVQQSSISHMDDMIKKKQAILIKRKKSDVAQYTSLYDEIAELMLSKNKLLMQMDRVDDIDTDQICNFILDYEEIEFIKTQFYKTPFHDDVAKTVQNIASLYQLCHPPMAGKYLNSVLQIKENIYGKESTETAKALDVLGDHYRIYMANFKKAIKEYEEAKRIRENLYGVNDSKITENYGRLALSLYYHGDKINRAEKLLLDSINIRKNSLPSKKFSLYDAYMDLGLHYSMKDEYDKSIIYLQKALKSFKGKVNSSYIVIRSELSQIYLNQDDLPTALKYGEEAYRVSKEFYGSDAHYQVLENSLRLTDINNRMNQENTK